MSFNGWHRTCSAYLGEEIEYRVGEDVERRATRCNERTPPPMIIFAAQLKVRYHDGDLGA